MHRPILLLALLFGACSAEAPPLSAENLDLPAPVAGVSMGAAYLTLSNNSDQEIVITSVASPELLSVEMHETTLVDGISRMRQLPKVTIPPQQSLIFERGARHLMLRYPSARPARLTLQFYSGDALLLAVDVTLEE